MLNGQFRRGFLRLLALAVLGVAAAYSQNTTAGALTGTVTDPTGAVIEGVQVTVMNQATHQESAKTTNATGLYDFENLQNGDYTISFSKQGFQVATVTNIHLDPG